MRPALSLAELAELADLWRRAKAHRSAPTATEAARRSELEQRLELRHVQPRPGRVGWAGVVHVATGQVVEAHGIVLRPHPRNAQGGAGDAPKGGA